MDRVAPVDSLLTEALPPLGAAQRRVEARMLEFGRQKAVQRDTTQRLRFHAVGERAQQREKSDCGARLPDRGGELDRMRRSLARTVEHVDGATGRQLAQPFHSSAQESRRMRCARHQRPVERRHAEFAAQRGIEFERASGYAR